MSGLLSAAQKTGLRRTIICLAILSALAAMTLGGLRVVGVSVEEHVAPSRISPADGKAFVFTLLPPQGLLQGWVPIGDSPESPSFSNLRVIVGGTALPTPHAVVADVAHLGNGRFRHDNNWHVFFSLVAASSAEDVVVTYPVYPRLLLILALLASSGLLLVAFFRQHALAITRIVWLRTCVRLTGFLSWIVAIERILPDRLPSPFAPRLAWAAATVLGGTWILWFNAHSPFDLAYCDYCLMTNVAEGKLAFPPGSIVGDFFRSAATVGPSVLTWLSHVTSAGAENAARILAGSFIAVGYLAACWLVWTLSRSAISIGVLAVLYPLGWLPHMMVGYVSSFWIVSPASGIWVQGGAMCLWCLWLIKPGRGWHAAIPYAGSGLLFTLHPTMGAILAAIFFFADLGEMLISPSDRLQLFRRMVVKGCAFCAATLPFWLSLPGSLGLASQDFDPGNWWKLMAFRKAHHIFLWNGDEILRSANLLIGSGLLVFNARWALGPARTLKVAMTICCVAIFFIISYISIKLVPTPRGAGMVLSRAGFLPFNIYMITLVALPWLIWRHGANRWINTVLAIGALALVPLSEPAWYSPSPRYPWLPEALVLILAAITLLRELPRPSVRPSSPQALAVGRLAARVLVVILTAVLILQAGSVKWRQYRDTSSHVSSTAPEISVQTAWNETKDWLVEHTRPESVLLLPPVISSYYPRGLPRIGLISDSSMGVSVYGLSFTGRELAMIKLVFDLDLAAMSVEEINATMDQAGGRLNLIEMRYLDLMSNRNRLLAVKNSVPDLEYAVTVKKGSSLPDFLTNVKSNTSPAALPIAFENDIFVIIDLRDTAHSK